MVVHQRFLFLGNPGQSLTHRVAFAQHEDVIVEEKHAHHPYSVNVGLELGQDHLGQLVASRAGGCEDTGNFHIESV